MSTSRMLFYKEKDLMHEARGLKLAQPKRLFTVGAINFMDYMSREVFEFRFIRIIGIFQFFKLRVYFILIFKFSKFLKYRKH